MRVTIAAVIGLLVGVTFLSASSGDAMAGGKGGSSIWIDASSYRAADGKLHVGQSVMVGFKTSYVDTTGGTGPWLQLQCYRAGSGYEGQLDGVLILSDSRAGFPGGWGYGTPFTLSGTSWHLGPANCKAVVGHKTNSGRFMVEASTSFYVAA